MLVGEEVVVEVFVGCCWCFGFGKVEWVVLHWCYHPVALERGKRFLGFGIDLGGGFGLG